MRQESNALLSKDSNVVQNVFFLYDVTGFTQIGQSIPVATNCTTAAHVPGLVVRFPAQSMPIGSLHAEQEGRPSSCRPGINADRMEGWGALAAPLGGHSLDPDWRPGAQRDADEPDEQSVPFIFRMTNEGRAIVGQMRKINYMVRTEKAYTAWRNEYLRVKGKDCESPPPSPSPTPLSSFGVLLEHVQPADHATDGSASE